jgi:hypothetical protein
LRFSQVPNRELLDSVSLRVDRTIALSATKTIGMRLTFIFLLLVLGSCTVTKRMHRPGYHIEWKATNAVQKSTVSSDREILAELPNEGQNEAYEKIQPKTFNQTTPEETVKPAIQENEKFKKLEMRSTALFQKVEAPRKVGRTISGIASMIKEHTAAADTLQKPKSYYVTMGILSLLLLLALVIILLATLKSPSLYYTAGVALLGIPLLFLFAIKNFKIARSIPIDRKVKIEKKAPELDKTSPSDKNTNNETTGTKPSEQNTVTRPKNGAAISSFVFLLASLTLAIIPFLGIILFLISFILGITAIVRDQRSSVPLRYTALAWVAVGIATVIISIFLLILLFLFL